MSAVAILAPPVGRTVRLRAFEAADLARVMVWRADEEIRGDAMWDARPFDSAAAERWLRVVSPPGADGRITFAIELRESRRLVGQTNLTRIDHADGTAYFGIVIGERDCRGRGLGSETLGLMLDYAKAIGLRSVLLDVASTNVRAVGLYRRAGFVVEHRPEQRDGILTMSRLLER